MSFRILIVEDEQIIAADLEELLVEMGHQVLGIAASGPEAIHMSVELRPQLVLMDFQLGSGITGGEVANKVRALTEARIIFITALPELVGRGAICIGKPFFRSEVSAALAAAQLGNK